jgi:5-methylcytosine-specific restriction protein A
MMTACHRCGKPTGEPGGVCPECKSASPANERPYDDAAWRRTSAAFLRRHRWCVLCSAEGLSTQATIADHYPETRKELLMRRVENPDDPKYLRPLCASHHATHGRKTRMRFDNDPA